MPSVIFDLDGTLLDSVPDIQAAVNRMLAEEGLAPLSRSTVQGFVGNGLPVLVARVMKECGIDESRHAELAARVSADYSAHAAVETVVFPGVIEALETLRNKGHRLGICTNKPNGATNAVLRSLDLLDRFDAIIAGDSLPQKKPAPEPLLAARDALGTKAIFVGDSEVDAATAQAAGMAFVLYTEGYLRVPKDEISFAAEFFHFDELPAIIQDLSAGR
ncbi:phosphoglycolate phosphatase [Albidovulum marisflavi]|uniref:phosphoglycolate phosphatase n=1 Tax=Albidovulum marisflavi TaxID=2984159 RepID=UPI0039917619